MNHKRLVITGATGFVGKALLEKLSEKYHSVVAPVRNPLSGLPDNIKMPLLKDIGLLPRDCNWFDNCDVVIHTAAKAHSPDISVDEYYRVNTEATLNLALLASNAGVKRFIFLSSIGVNGVSNTKPFSINDRPAPTEDYAASKLEAENGLRRISAETGIELVIIRPPLVYGPLAPGNFGKLANLAKKNFPLPLGAVHNKRSFISVGNLVDLIVTCIEHTNAGNQTFLVSDDQDVSTSNLLKMMILAAGKRPWLLPVPVAILKIIGKLTGNQSLIDRLCSNLQIDIQHTKDTLGWTPPYTLEEGIKRCFVKEEMS